MLFRSHNELTVLSVHVRYVALAKDNLIFLQLIVGTTEPTSVSVF
jgi:hypothetical protein